MAVTPSWQGQCNNLRLLDGLEETYNPFVAAADVIRGTAITLECYERLKSQGVMSSWLAGMTNDIRFYWNFKIIDVIIVGFLTICWTILRRNCVDYVFKPIARHVSVLDHNVAKFGESMWKFMAYGFMWLSAVYVTFFRGYDFFQRPMQLWADHRPNESPLDLYTLYAIETSFYLHSIYATLYMDAWRKDSIVMLVHHLVTLTLIFASYAVGFLKIGVIIFVLDDISDVVLESGKAATYLRHRKSGFSSFFDAISNITGVTFAVQWAILRLQFHMTKVWRTGAIGVWVSHPMLPVPFHLFFITFLGSLFLFYSYWFFYIVLFVVRIVCGKQGSAEDPREDEDTKKMRRNRSMTHTMAIDSDDGTSSKEGSNGFQHQNGKKNE